MFDDNSETYGSKAAFLRHEDSGSDVTDSNMYNKAMSRMYREYKAGTLTFKPGDEKKRHHFPILEDALNKHLDKMEEDGDLLPLRSVLQKMALELAGFLDVYPNFKASPCWAAGFLANRQALKEARENQINKAITSAQEQANDNDVVQIGSDLACMEVDDTSMSFHSFSLSDSSGGKRLLRSALKAAASTNSEQSHIKPPSMEATNSPSSVVNAQQSVQCSDDITLGASSSEATNSFDRQVASTLLISFTSSTWKSLNVSSMASPSATRQRESASFIRSDSDEYMNEECRDAIHPFVAKRDHYQQQNNNARNNKSSGNDSAVSDTPINMELSVSADTDSATILSHQVTKAVHHSVQYIIKKISVASRRKEIDVLESCLKTLMDILIRHDGLPMNDSNAKDNVVHTIVQVIAQHRSHVALVTLGFGVIASLSDLQEEKTPPLVIRTVSVAMDHNTHCPLLQAAGCGVLQTLAWYSLSNKVTIFQYGGIARIKLAMLRHQEHCEVQRKACNSLATLADNCPINQKCIVDCGVLALVTSAMIRYFSDCELQRNGLGVLGLCVLNHLLSQGLAISTEDMVTAMVTAMKHHPNDSDIQSRACIMFAQFLDSNDHQKEIGLSGCIEAMIAAIQSHDNDFDIQLWGCKVLGRLAFRHQVNRAAIIAAGGIVAVLTAMYSHAKHPQIHHTAATEVLSSLVSDHSCTQQHTTSAFPGGITALVSVMQKYASDSEIQQWCCRILGNLASQDYFGQIAVALTGGTLTILAAMYSHYDHSKTQHAAIEALRALSSYHYANQTAIDPSGGIKVVAAAMQRHADDAKIQNWGCKVLYRLVSESSLNPVEIVTALTAMDSHYAVFDFQNATIEALPPTISSHLLSNPNEIGVTCCDIGAMVLFAMQRHVTNSKIQLLGCKVLGKLASRNSSNQPASISSVVSVLTAMYSHSEHSGIHQAAIEFLRAITSDRRFSDQTGIGSTGDGVQTVVATMQKYCENTEIQQWSCKVLGKLAPQDCFNQTAIASADSIVAVLTALYSVHLGHRPESRRSAIEALRRLTAYHIANQRKINSSGGVTAIVAAMESQHVDDGNVEIQKWGCKVLGKLAMQHALNETAIAAAERIITSPKEPSQIDDQPCGLHQAAAAAAVVDEALRTMKLNHSQNQRKLNSPDSIEAVTTAMKRYEDDSEIQQWCRQFLGQYK